MENSF